jgi:hypothetical protein
VYYSNTLEGFAEKTHRLQQFFEGEQIAHSREIVVTNVCGVAQSIFDEVDAVFAEALNSPEDESCETMQLSEAQNEPEAAIPQAEEPASKGEGVVSPSPISLFLPSTLPFPSKPASTLTPHDRHAPTDEDQEIYAILSTLDDDPTTWTPEPIVQPVPLVVRLRQLEEDRKARQREADEQRAAQVKPIRRQWCSLTPEERLLVTFRFAAQLDGLALTLQFSKANEARYRKSDDPARALSRSLNRALKKHLGHALEYAFAFEFSPLTGKLHAHGVIIPGAHDPDQIRAALYSTTGKAESKYGQGRMVDLVPISDSTGWHGYTLKDFAKTRKRLTGKPFFITESFRRGAEAWHDSKKPTAARPRISKPSPANDNGRATSAPEAGYESNIVIAAQVLVKPHCGAQIVRLGSTRNNLKRMNDEAARPYRFGYRTLSSTGGNPDPLWSETGRRLVVIDHNLPLMKRHSFTGLPRSGGSVPRARCKIRRCAR